MFNIDPEAMLKPLADRTKKDYLSKLNLLEREGLANDRASLKKNAKKIINFINTLYEGDDEKVRQKKRFIVYSIFWAMDEKYKKRKNLYHTYVNKIPPFTNVATGDAWVPVKEFKFS